MENMHTDDKVLRVKIFLSFKVNPTQKICSSICFFSFTFFREVIILLPRRRRGEGGGGRGCSEDFGGIAWFSGEAGPDCRQSTANDGGGGREIIQILRSLEGLGGFCCKILRPTSTPPPSPFWR